MLVKEVIEFLSKFDPEKEVLIWEGESCGCISGPCLVTSLETNNTISLKGELVDCPTLVSETYFKR